MLNYSMISVVRGGQAIPTELSGVVVFKHHNHSLPSRLTRTAPTLRAARAVLSRCHRASGRRSSNSCRAQHQSARSEVRTGVPFAMKQRSACRCNRPRRLTKLPIRAVLRIFRTCARVSALELLSAR